MKQGMNDGSAAPFRPDATFPALTGFWAHWGFSPWESGPCRGVQRRQRFVKGGLLGSIAEYYAWDYIIWSPGSPDDRETLWRSLKPLPEVLTQRYLFLLDTPWTKRRIRSFCFGLRGFAEMYAYWPGVSPTEEPEDLTGLVHLALRQDQDLARDAE